MIPFSILNGIMYMKDGVSLEIRILELAPDYFTTRVPSDWYCEHGACVAVTGIRLFFLSAEDNHLAISKDPYTEVMLSSNQLCIQREMEPDTTESRKNEQDAYCLTITTSSNLYRKESLRLSRLYLQYIDNKYELEPPQLAAEMTNYPAERENDFAPSLQAQYAEWVDEMQELLAINECSLTESCRAALALESAENWKLFLETPSNLLWENYVKRYHLPKAIYKSCAVQDILVGNPYCTQLYPSIEMLEQILRKAYDESWNIHLVLAPITEKELTKWLNHINYVNQFVQDQLPGFHITWQANDWGIFSYIYEKQSVLFEEAKGCVPFSVETGPLLHKTYRDPRKRYLCNVKEELMKSGAGLYFPYYQTNTGTHCPMYAQYEYGKRGAQCLVEDCPHYCEKAVFLYPRHLRMIGRYNSLFGFAVSALETLAEVYTYVNEKKQLLIFNF